MSRVMAKILAVWFVAMSVHCNAATVSITPISQIVDQGSSFSVELNVTGLIDGLAPSLGTFDIDVSFDSAVLAFSGITFGNQLDISGLGSIRSATPSVGMLNIFELSLDAAADLDALQAGAGGF